MPAHKHAAVIKAWADGAEVQIYVHNTGNWFTYGPGHSPCWSETSKYRVKPKTIRYRVALLDDGVVIATRGVDNGWEQHPNFKRWLTDWTEVEE